ncbi:uncharacterized protein LOC111051506 isoform X2 [Nilaparvata lugens]|uniref:uncharacterized protein LOC111051506 isoform X2 n=1 Tax=Nilaparvata lugens TaxID=108931 RepID=UPI00193E3BA2|nr:uncharacterized protein LOC111051506 isoform X2 [Nilaparvata lugens]
MSCSKYKAWFQSMMGNIEPNSVIVLANRVYNTTQIDKPPSISNSKQEIIDWLTNKNIDRDGLDPDPFKVELLHLVKKNKPPERYELDEMAAEFGHRVVRLPPFGFYFNAINVVWTQIKDKIAERNTVFKLDSVEKLFSEAIAEVTPDDWRNAVLHTKQVIEQAIRDEFELDDAVDDLLERVINPSLADGSDSEFCDSDSDSDDSGLDQCSWIIFRQLTSS